MNIFSSDNALLQEQLDINGFVKIKLLPSEIVRRLLDLYESSPKAKNPHFGFHITLDISSAENIDAISKEISSILTPLADKFLSGYKFISPRFAVKEPDQNSNIPPHQDWSFVDESRYQSYNLWIALTPATLNNGTLGFLKKSHTALNNFRATPLPIFKVPFHDYAYELTNELAYSELEPGEAFIFNSRTIHASKPNITHEPRINIAVEVSSADAPLIHYYLSPKDNVIVEYAIDEHFFTKYSNAKLTRLYEAKQVPDDFPVTNRIKNVVDKIDKKTLLNLCK